MKVVTWCSSATDLEVVTPEGILKFYPRGDGRGVTNNLTPIEKVIHYVYCFV